MPPSEATKMSPAISLTPARQEMLIRVLLACDKVVYFSPSYSDKKSGVYRCLLTKSESMVRALRSRGLITWEYSRVYSTRELIDVQLTEKGRHVAARCLLWKYRKDLQSHPPVMWPNSLKKPL